MRWKNEEKRTNYHGVSFDLGVAGIITCGIIGMVEDREARPQDVTLADLPKPELAGGLRGEMGIDKNINETNIDQYLGRDDAVYRDMRMLVDDANYEAIGGDSICRAMWKVLKWFPIHC